MPLPHEREENRGVLAYLGGGLQPSQVPVEVPGPEVDTWHLGAHPDIVQRLWRQLARPGLMPVLAGHTAALLDERSGLIIGVALGTQYGLRLPESSLPSALQVGFRTVHRFDTVGRTLDLASAFGPGWVFGQYDEREAAWLQEGA